MNSFLFKSGFNKDLPLGRILQQRVPLWDIDVTTGFR